MKTYTFPYYVSFGRGDNVDAEVDCELSDEMAERLEASANEGDRFELDEDDAIDDIFQLVFKAIIDQERENLLEDPQAVEDALSWEEDYDSDAPITLDQINDYLDELSIGINYPEDLQFL